ncbi:hypothetical protein FG489_024155 [Salmonella enterica subsp. enterica serovar Derby]|nr:hypothetical protein FG489_024155 [Salmonella enterica subsp. enterica serovar Derby]
MVSHAGMGNNLNQSRFGVRFDVTINVVVFNVPSSRRRCSSSVSVTHIVSIFSHVWLTIPAACPFKELFFGSADGEHFAGAGPDNPPAGGLAATLVRGDGVCVHLRSGGGRLFFF